ncbi:MAG: PKD domain-containing protein [Flavobacteriales bacterium]|nr:PKD domain-containing protein [Flavobacteriales bacterium]
MDIIRNLCGIATLLITWGANAQSFYRQIGDPGRLERGHAMHRAAGGELFIGGTLGDSAFVQRIDTLGQVLWTRAFKPGNLEAIVWHLTTTTDGHLIGCGSGITYVTPHRYDDAFHFKLDLNGNLVWLRMTDHTEPLFARRIIPLPNGEYLLFGGAYPLGNSTWADLLTARIDPLTGDILWLSPKINQYTPLPYIDDLGGATTLGNGHYATGYLYTDGSSVSTCRVALAHYDMLGSHLWSKYLFFSNNVAANMYGSDVIAHDDSLTLSFFGNPSGGSVNYRAGLARLDSNGTIAWARMYDIAGSNIEMTTTVAATAQGYLLVGATIGGGDRGLFAMEVSRGGTLLWARSYGALSNEEGPISIAPNLVLEDDHFWLAGRSLDSLNNEDLVLLRAEADGTIPCHATNDLVVTTASVPPVAYDMQPIYTPVSFTLLPTAGAGVSGITDACATAVDLGPDTTSCDPVLLDAGNPGASYLWSDGSTGQTLLGDTGTYWVQVTVACCTRTDTIHIGGGDPPVADFTWAQDPPGSTTVVLTDTSANADWNTWLLGSSIASGDSITHDFGEYGHYVVGLIVGNDCGTDTVWQQVDVFPATGITSLAATNGLTCAVIGDQLVVAMPGVGPWEIRVFDAQGALLAASRTTGDRSTLPIRGAASGVLTIEALSEGRRLVGRAAVLR